MKTLVFIQLSLLSQGDSTVMLLIGFSIFSVEVLNIKITND